MENALKTGVGPALIAYWAEEYTRLFGPSGTADKMKSADQIPPDEMKKYVDNYNKWFDAALDADGTKTKLDVLRRLRDWLRVNLDTLDKLIKYMESTFALLVVMVVAGCQSGKYEIDTDVSSANEKLTYRIVEKLNPEACSEEYLPVEVSVKKSSGSDNSGGLCFLTLGIIPAFYDDFETIVVTVKTPIGTKTGSGSLHAKKWIGWICLIPYPGSAESRSDNPRLPNSTLEDKVKNQIVESLVSQFPKEEYVAFLNKIKQDKVAEQQRVQKKKQMIENLIKEEKFEDAIKACASENDGTGKENPWAEISVRAFGALKKSIPSINDEKRLVSLFSMVNDIASKDLIVCRLAKLGKCSELGEDNLKKYVIDSSFEEGRLCAVSTITNKDALIGIANAKYSKSITLAAFKKLTADDFRDSIFAGAKIDEEFAGWYLDAYGTDQELIAIINLRGDKLGFAVEKMIRSKTNSTHVLDELNKLVIRSKAAKFREIDVKYDLFGKLFLEIESVSDPVVRASLAEILLNRHIVLNQEKEIYFKEATRKEIRKFVGFLSKKYCEKLLPRLSSISCLGCDDLAVHAKEIFADEILDRIGAEKEYVQSAASRFRAHERIHFEGFYIGMSWVDYYLKCKQIGVWLPATFNESGMMSWIKFPRTWRYKLFEKEDGEFWPAFMRKYIPAGKKKSLGETISDALDSGTYSYQEGYDDKLEEHCYIYKSMKYGTKVLFGEKSGTLVLEEYK